MKESILDAAERVIKRQGMANTTMENVAAEAGITKGGVFYHFSSKKDMLLELVERYETRFTARRQEVFDSLPEDPNRLLKATVIASLRDPERKEGCNNLSNILTMLDDVEIRQKVFDMKQRLLREVWSAYEKPEKPILALLAVDGLWIMDMFGCSPIPHELEEGIIEELLRLIDIHQPEKMGEP